MKIFLKILKWIGISIGGLLLMIILSGLFYRLFGPNPHSPKGEMIDVGGFNLHIHSTGEKNNQPTLVIEGGSGVSTDYYHWLSEGLKDTMRVVRYDRAGIGYSDACQTPRDPEIIARELHTLLERAGESPPYILAAHSLGGPYISVFTQLYPEEVVGMVFMDTTHPERVERMNLPLKSSFKYKSMMWFQNALIALGELGIVGLYDNLFGPVLVGEGLPDEINKRNHDFLLNGKLIRAATMELELYHATLKRAGEISGFGSLPIRVFAADEYNEEVYRRRGIDPVKRRAEEIQMDRELSELSTDGELFLLDGNHNTIYTKKENADIICKEIIELFDQLKRE